jgi:hypothetical protein
MFDFWIPGFRPAWVANRAGLVATHADRFRGLVGQVLTGVALMWDFTDDAWWADGPVVLVFDHGAQLELLHHKFSDLSVTWNTIDLSAALDGGEDPEWHRDLGWCLDMPNGLAPLRGGRVERFQILRWAEAPKGSRDGALGLGLVLTTGAMVVLNALDENGILIGDGQPEWTAVWST